jgi:hypothetical protein
MNIVIISTPDLTISLFKHHVIVEINEEIRSFPLEPGFKKIVKVKANSGYEEFCESFKATNEEAYAFYCFYP